MLSKEKSVFKGQAAEHGQIKLNSALNKQLNKVTRQSNYLFIFWFSEIRALFRW